MTFIGIFDIEPGPRKPPPYGTNYQTIHFTLMWTGMASHEIDNYTNLLHSMGYCYISLNTYLVSFYIFLYTFNCDLLF